ncbi:MAG: NAD(P)/FAD-dependent oxidoreductase [Desulfobacterales bacterium]|nr:NAD(P)/FAD-dependent oxidoreductase [Desulfobacterales bacterium]
MMSGRQTQGDVLIIGSGIGGLTAGIILAKLNCRVTVVERNPLPGGLMRGYLRSGIECPVGVHYMGSLGKGQPLRRMWDCLGVTPLIPVERMGADGVIDRYIFDGFTFDLPEGIDAFEDNLRRSFPLEHSLITTIMDDLRRTSRALTSLNILISPAMSLLSPESFESMGEQLLRMGCSRRLLSVLGVPSTLIGLSLRECPVFYYHMTIASYLMSSWRLACNSSQMADAFVSRFMSLGGDVVTGDGVARILVQSGRVKGVVLQSGRILEARSIIAAVHPGTVVAMLPGDAVRPAYVERVAELENTKGLFVVNLAVDADAHKALSYNIYRLYPEEDGTLSQGVFHQLRNSGQPGINILSMMTTSGIEEWRQWEGTTSGKRGSDYLEAKEKKARRFIGEASKLFGDLKGMRILDTYTPLTIRDRVNSPDGSAYGILRSTGQFMKTASLNRTSIEGLFLAGQNSMAPGIMGTTMGSFQTVRNVIGYERFSREVMGDFL